MGLCKAVLQAASLHSRHNYNVRMCMRAGTQPGLVCVTYPVPQGRLRVIAIQGKLCQLALQRCALPLQVQQTAAQSLQ